MSQLDNFTDDTLELYNIERNILLRMLKDKGVAIKAEELRKMARKERSLAPTDHPGDIAEKVLDVEKYDE